MKRPLLGEVGAALQMLDEIGTALSMVLDNRQGYPRAGHLEEIKGVLESILSVLEERKA